MKKQWDDCKKITFKVGLPEKKPTLEELVAVFKFRKVSELLRTLINFVKTESGKNALQDFISKEKE